MGAELVPEEFGGDTVVVPISALAGDGIDDLLENVLLVADLEELKANPDRGAIGVVLEAATDRAAASRRRSSCRPARCAPAT